MVSKQRVSRVTRGSKKEAVGLGRKHPSKIVNTPFGFVHYCHVPYVNVKSRPKEASTAFLSVTSPPENIEKVFDNQVGHWPFSASRYSSESIGVSEHLL